MKSITCSLAIVTLCSFTLHSGEPAVRWNGQGADYFSDDDGPSTIGFQFRTTTGIQVTALGAFDHLGDGFTEAHIVGIWAAGNTTPLITATIPAGEVSPLVGAFRYVDIASLTLSANTDYMVAASGFYGSANDLYAGSVPVTAFSMSPGISFEGSRGAGEAPGLNYPNGFREPLSPTTFSANFQFATIPEPSTWILLALGGGLLAKACLRSRPQDPQPGR